MNADGSTANGSSLIDEIVREGARRMLAAALEAEVNAYIAKLADQRDENGHRLVVRHGYHQPRTVTTLDALHGLLPGCPGTRVVLLLHIGLVAPEGLVKPLVGVSAVRVSSVRRVLACKPS